MSMREDNIALLASDMGFDTLHPQAFSKLSQHAADMGITNSITDFHSVGQFANAARSIALSKNTAQSKAAMSAMALIEQTVFAKHGN